MKYFYKRTLSLLLVVLVVIGCVGCGKSCKDDESGDATNKRHNVEMVKTDKYLVSNGTTEYKIVYSTAENDERYNFSISELQFFFKESTGISLQAVSDDGLNYTDSDKYISLGSTSVLKTSEIDVNEDFIGVQGVRILTKGNTVFLYGNTGAAVLNSVYFFLQLTFGYDHYVMDYVIDRNVKNVSLFNYDVTEIPDVTYRNLGQAIIYTSSTLARRLMSSDKQSADRINVQNFEEGGTGASPNHNALFYCPPSKFNNPDNPETYHPKWYSSDGTQLCYTAHGDTDEYNALIEQIIEVGKRNLIRDQDNSILPFSSSDVVSVCNCDACRKAYEEYGANSGANLKVLNELYKGLMNWFKTDEGKPYARDLKVTTLAYNEYTAPPAKKNSKGEYEATIKAEDGVTISYAPINMDWNKSIYDEANSSYAESFEGWKVVTKDFSFWFYSVNYSNFFAPFNYFDSMQDNFKAMVGYGNCSWMTDCGTQAIVSGGFQTLLIYLDTKLMWNVNADFECYVKKFFEMAYGVVAEEMYDMFMEFRLCAKIAQSNGFVGDIYLRGDKIYKNINGVEYWPRAIMTEWVKRYNNMLDQVSMYKDSDVKLYETYYNRIARERLLPLYVLSNYYDAELRKDDLLTYRNQFKSDCLLFGNTIAGHSPTSLLADLYASWGI